ncbi:tetratricopeptide (TPR) repeat protein [Rhizobium paknamense]|uniref:Tetratricopeptide (TPR) repeat protein n=2 Tax=Rhizobium paknamense TaxID=1206817 RepID=A0ABU0I9L3_9HYPH|nr:tetratricopeptide (TPR) repeat protein [Rhizobium paknamense]
MMTASRLRMRSQWWSVMAGLVLAVSPALAQELDLSPGHDKGAEEPGFQMLAQADPSPMRGTQPAPQPQGGAQPPAAAQPQVDESALRYFAARGDTARLQAEISRLKTLYPNWQPPADPLAVPANPDPQLETLWRLYSEGRYGEVRKMIGDRLAAEPGWTPPQDLLDRLAAAESRMAIIDASDKGRYEEVITKAAATPSLLNCNDVDVLWRVAEAFARTERPSRALDAYRYVLKSCQAEPERLATVQKAMTLLPYGPMQDLLALEKPASGGGREFDPIRDDLARHFVAEGGTETTLTVAESYLNRLKTTAQAGNAGDATLLGWYTFRRKDMAEAERWFRLSNDRSPNADAAQGLALTLIERKAYDQAEDALYRWRNTNNDSRATYFAATANLLAKDPPPLLAQDVLARISQATMEGRDAATAQQFGWYARGLNQNEAARRWFETALSWKADDEPSAYGLALTFDQQKNLAALEALKRQWAARSERIAAIGVEAETERPVSKPATARTERARAHKTEAVAETSAMAQASARREAARPVSANGCDGKAASTGAQLAAGWCLMRLNRPLEATAAFEQALTSTAATERSDAAYGLSLAYLRLGLTGKAAVAATRAPLSPQRARELQAAILSDRAIAAYSSKLYANALLLLDQRAQLAPERIDLMVLRGYSYMGLKRYGDAIRIFEAAAATGNAEASRGLNDAREAYDEQAGIR